MIGAKAHGPPPLSTVCYSTPQPNVMIIIVRSSNRSEQPSAAVSSSSSSSSNTQRRHTRRTAVCTTHYYPSTQLHCCCGETAVQVSLQAAFKSSNTKTAACRSPAYPMTTRDRNSLGPDASRPFTVKQLLEQPLTDGTCACRYPYCYCCKISPGRQSSHRRLP